ncbi:MAG TPA: cytochrome c oxidase subunit II [Candidatus Sulfotelmatobacter sp.]|nr:cytochrome c oxidase subunit II [Candidatus Sulfotelmatobacter sp.]
MHVHRLERIWIGMGLAMLVFFIAVIATSAVVDGFVPPSRTQTIDPAKVSSTPPFDHPGLHQIGPGQYEAYYVGHIFSWDPATITVPTGAHVTFYLTSTDVMHGFSIPETGVNASVTPGWVNAVSQTFRKPGTYLVLCNEYCGAGHQLMAAKVIVQ